MKPVILSPKPAWTHSLSPLAPSHGAYKFSSEPTGEVLRMDVIEEIHRRLPNTHIVMHGSSSPATEPARHHQRVWW